MNQHPPDLTLVEELSFFFLVTDGLVEIAVVHVFHDDAKSNKWIPKDFSLQEGFLVGDYVGVMDGGEDPDLVESVL